MKSRPELVNCDNFAAGFSPTDNFVTSYYTAYCAIIQYVSEVSTAAVEDPTEQDAEMDINARYGGRRFLVSKAPKPWPCRIQIPLPSQPISSEFVAIAERAVVAKSVLKQSITDFNQVMKGLRNG